MDVISTVLHNRTHTLASHMERGVGGGGWVGIVEGRGVTGGERIERRLGRAVPLPSWVIRVSQRFLICNP